MYFWYTILLMIYPGDMRLWRSICYDGYMASNTFETELYTIDSWTIARLPRAVSEAFPSRGQVMSRGTIKGYDFQTPLEPDGDGSHWLHVDARMRETTGLQAGDTVTVEIEPTKEWPEPEIPHDLQAALNSATPEVQALWKKVTPMAHWEWLRWINATTNPETRTKRIEVSISKLTKGMRRPCCFNRNMCCVPEVSKNGVLLDITQLQTVSR